MAIVGIKMKEPEERGNISRAVPSFLPAGEQREPTLVIKLVAATRERKLAALRISELARQAVDTLFNLAEGTTNYPQE